MTRSPKTKQLVIRLTPKMHRQIKAAAAADCGSTVSNWARRVLLNACELSQIQPANS